MMAMLLLQMDVILLVNEKMDILVLLQEVLVCKHVETVLWIPDKHVMMVILVLEMVVMLTVKHRLDTHVQLQEVLVY